MTNLMISNEGKKADNPTLVNGDVGSAGGNKFVPQTVAEAKLRKPSPLVEFKKHNSTSKSGEKSKAKMASMAKNGDSHISSK